VDALFRNPQSLSEAAKKGMAASKEMESLGLDVSKNSDFFKYEEMNGGSTGLDYLMGIDRKKYANGSLDEFLKSTTLVSPSGKSYNYDLIKSLPTSGQGATQ
jgi:hypothetical protein